MHVTLYIHTYSPPVQESEETTEEQLLPEREGEEKGEGETEGEEKGEGEEVDEPPPPTEHTDEPDMWEENFKGHHDSKPYGGYIVSGGVVTYCHY